jgi:hypothetical protein
MASTLPVAPTESPSRFPSPYLRVLAPREATLTVVERSTAFLNDALRGDARYRRLLLAERAGLTVESAER